jgi:hypothetical protein
MPLDELAGIVQIGKTPTVSLVLRSGAARVRVAGQPAHRIGAAVSGLSLGRLGAAPAQAQLDAVGWVEGESGRGSVVTRDGSLQGISLGALGLLDRQGPRAHILASSLRLGQAVAKISGDAQCGGDR